MGVQKKEVEATSTLSAEKLYKGFLLDMHTVVPKAFPQAIKSVEILEGEGGVGTIRLVTLGEAGQFKTIKQRVDAVDKDALTFSYTVIGGDILLDIIESINNHFSFVSTDGGCIVKNTTTYNTKGHAVIPEEDIKEIIEKSAQIFKAVEAYVLAN